MNLNNAISSREWDKAFEDLSILEQGRRNLFEGGNLERFSGNTPDARDEHMYYQDIQHVYDKLEVGERVIISFDVQMVKGEFLQVYCSNHPTDKMFKPANSVTQVFRNIGTEKQRLSFEAIIEDTGRVRRSTPAEIEFYTMYGSEDWFTVGNLKIEKGVGEASPYTLSPEYLGASIFIADIADASYRNKENRKEIRELSNAITSLGGNI